jgi:cob(I)alamin adenosyltransferase
MKENRTNARRIQVAVLTISDRSSKGEREDLSGKVIEEIVRSNGWEVAYYGVVPDDKETIRTELIKMEAQLKVDLVLTTGGTGLAPRDFTPEATLEVIDREVPGLAEAMRMESLKKTPHAMLSRAVCGARGKTLIVNLPGSPRAVRECLEVIAPAIPHAQELMQGGVSDCATEREAGSLQRRKGMVLVYTGNGKGKTTAALGLALRALGQGRRVFMLQFKKSDPGSGEIQAIQKYLPDFKVVQAGRNRMSPDGVLLDDQQSVVLDGFIQGKEALSSGEYDLVIFDEINIVMHRGQLSIQEVIDMLANRPEHVDVVLTGRYAPAEIINAADLVSEVQEVKHYFRAGVKAMAGLEF